MTTSDMQGASPIRSLLVANRGEIARRIIRTARDLGITTVAVHSDADADAPFVTDADRAVHLPGNAPADTYLRGDLVIAAAQRAGADAVHPGYGFLSENADFARDVIAAGLTWVGPPPDAIEAMGSKVRAKELMVAAGVPTLSVDRDALQDNDFPLLVKASAGGGGRGMRIVEDRASLDRTIAAASAEAESAFGDGTVFVEPYLLGARHIEVQVVADTHGTIWVVGDRDCSLQRRHQKVLEEAPAPRVSDPVRAALHEAAHAAAKAVDYVGAGTVEFLVDRAHEDDGRAYFLEMNTRLQVEHPVTEAVTGLDLVALQLAVAEGATLTGEPPEPSGHAVEVRVYAEDPAADWRPQTGTVRSLGLGPATGGLAATRFGGAAAYGSTTHGLRLDTAVEVGSEVGIHYDAMLAKLVAWGPDRTRALRLLSRGLAELGLRGVTTNVELLRAMVDDEAVVAAEVHTGLVEERLTAWTDAGPGEDDLGRLALAAALAQASRASTQARVLARIPTAFRNVPSQPRTRTFGVGDREVAVSYAAERGRLVQRDLEGVEVVEASPTRVVLSDNGVRETYTVRLGPDDTSDVDVEGPRGGVSLTPVPTFVDPAEQVAEGSLLAPMPASVVRVAVEPGQQVNRGEVVLVLEAMKMQHSVEAPVDGVVGEVSVSAGDQVGSGAVLAVITPSEQGAPA